MSTTTPAVFRPHVREWHWYEERVPGWLVALQSGLAQPLEIARQLHPRFAGVSDADLRKGFTADDARLVLAREHGFTSWNDFRTHVADIAAGRVVEPFIAAFEAIKAGDVSAVKALLTAHNDLVNAQGTNGSSLLNLASSMRQPAICKLLLDHRADVNLATTRGVSPVHQAAYSNQAELVTLFTDAGARLDGSAYGDGGTPLVMALFWGHDAARDAIAKKSHAPNNLRAAAGTGDLKLAESCFGAAGNLTPAAGAHRSFYRPHTGFPAWTPSDSRQEVLDEAFVYAARNGQIPMLGWLLDKGAQINADPYRGTALVWATVRGRSETVTWLLDHGANINARSTFGGLSHGKNITALHSAAESNLTAIAQLLLSRGADRTVTDDNYKSTPSGWASHFGHTDLAELLAPG